jgi:hypothetical protein
MVGIASGDMHRPRKVENVSIERSEADVGIDQHGQERDQHRDQHLRKYQAEPQKQHGAIAICG